MAEERQIFKEFGISAASAWALSGEDPESEKALQGEKAVATWEEMRRGDHTGAAIVAGLTLPIRRSSWNVEPTSSKAADQEAADFLEQCMEDMSHSWSAMIVDALTMFPFGWSWLEQIMKRRQGLAPPGRDAARSKYDDGRIGWRKIALRPQTTLDHWQVDDHGGIQALYQLIPRKEKPVPIPIQRSLLFRTTTEGNHPEGVSIFRPAWRPWRHRSRLEIVEGMAFTRNLAGLLKITLGPSATTIETSQQESDEAKAQKMIKDAYDDRLVGIIESDQLRATVMEGPRGTNFTAIGRAITRKDHEMARAALAHFIILALQERGSYSLAKDESDLFLMAVMAYLEAMQDIIQRFAVERLFRLNVFPGIIDVPQIGATAVYKPDLGEVAEAINNLAGANLLTIDDGLEAYIRDLAGWPELPADLTRAKRAEQELQEPKKPEPPDQPPSTEEGITGEEEEEHAQYAAPGGGQTGRRYLRASRTYEQDLQAIYRDWSSDTATGSVSDLGPEATEEQLWAKLDDYLGVGILLLMEKGYQDLVAAYILGFGSPSVGPDGLRLIEQAQQKNDNYLAGSLFADIRGQLEGQIAAILLLLKYGRQKEAADLIEHTILSLDWRIPLYGGTYWEMINAAIGMRLTERGAEEGPPVRRVLDPLAQHCATCPPKAKEYPSWDAMVAEAGIPGDGSDECNGRCRCHVEVLDEGIWIWA